MTGSKDKDRHPGWLPADQGFIRRYYFPSVEGIDRYVMRFASHRPAQTLSRIKPQARLRNERIIKPVANIAVGKRGTSPVSIYVPSRG
jgi:hypothetical protein